MIVDEQHSVSQQDPSPLDPHAAQIMEILAINFVWHMRTQIHPSQHQLAWEHFLAVMHGSRSASPASYHAALSDKIVPDNQSISPHQ